eukprot:8557686-Pyramimonas_sp.AAC.1
MATRRHLRSPIAIHSSQSHARLHLGQTFEHCERTGLRHEPPGLRAAPGHRLSAQIGHAGPACQRPPRIGRLPA